MWAFCNLDGGLPLLRELLADSSAGPPFASRRPTIKIILGAGRLRFFPRRKGLGCFFSQLPAQQRGNLADPGNSCFLSSNLFPFARAQPRPRTGGLRLWLWRLASPHAALLLTRSASGHRQPTAADCTRALRGTRKSARTSLTSGTGPSRLCAPAPGRARRLVASGGIRPRGGKGPTTRAAHACLKS